MNEPKIPVLFTMEPTDAIPFPKKGHIINNIAPKRTAATEVTMGTNLDPPKKS